MSSNEFAVSIQGLSKCYGIYASPTDRLKQFILPRVQRMTGRTPKKYFKEFWALENVSFEVKKGETVGIVGRNGSGKSTLLQMICGTLSPTSGSIQTNGRIAALLELGSGFNPEFTGRENVFMNASVLGLRNEQIYARFDDIVAFAGIGEFIDQPVKTYSSGMTVRLAFSVIAHVDADILIVDEALAVGDAFFTQKCMRFLRDFMKTGTVLFVSHDTGAVVNLCSKAVLLNQGKVVEIGTPKSVTEHYLAKVYEPNQEVNGVAANKADVSVISEQSLIEYKDMRSGFLNNSNLRNDIEVFQFSPDNESFGTGDAKISSVRLLDNQGAVLTWIVGGEDVVLEVCCRAYKEIARPIVGFEFKDRLGQVIFSDNTFLVFADRQPLVAQDGILTAKFEFRLPILPSGDYSIGAAIAEGSQESHVQHHWMHEALLIRVHASSVCFGIIGVAMKEVTLTSV